MSQPAKLAFASLKFAEMEDVSWLCLSHSHKGSSRGAEKWSTWLLSVCDKAPGAIMSSAHPSDAGVSC